jgi:uncharacterized membrane protein
MTNAQHTVSVEAPIAAVYQQWLDVESFPQFIPLVREVTTSAEIYSHWTISVGRLTRSFDAEIVEQLPEERVSWRTITGDVTATGEATFSETSDTRTAVTLSVTWEPSTPAERAAAALGTDDRAVKAALRAFKSHVETNGGPSGHSYVTLRSVDADPDTTVSTDDDADDAATPAPRRGRHARE